MDDIDALPFPPRTVNIKPSRFGSWRACEAYDACAERGMGAYGGGQFELGPGRGQIQLLAALFHPDGPNDTAPREFNSADTYLPAREPDAREAERDRLSLGRRFRGLGQRPVGHTHAHVEAHVPRRTRLALPPEAAAPRADGRGSGDGTPPRPVIARAADGPTRAHVSCPSACATA